MKRFLFASIITIFLLLSVLHTDAYDGQKIICGDARMEKYLPALKGKRIALLINQTATINNKLLLDTLLKNKVAINKVFVPEHGFRGNEDAGAIINNEVDATTGIRIISLYGKNKKPTSAQLQDIDIIIYDLQDVGVRFYTYISTLQYLMEACAENNKELIILDRPNPNGFYIDGPVLDTSERSFVGLQPVPAVYGMTVGEYARMLKGEHLFDGADKLNMKIVTCEGYDHNTHYELQVAPSPNLRNMAAVYLYPSLCFFEGTNISVGRGTDRVFQQWGAPDLVDKYSYSFIPQSTKGASKPMYEDKVCYGELIATNGLEALAVVQNKLNIGWLIAAYNASHDKTKFFNPFFEKLAGNKTLREQIIQGKSEDNIRASWQKDISAFKKIRKKYLLYKDFE